MYRGYYDEFAMGDKKKEEVLEVMKAHLKLKDQRVAPLRSPRVVLVTPPHLRHRASELFELLANKYGFHRIPVQAIINEHIEKKTEVGKFVHRNLRVGQPIPNDILTTLVRTEMTKSVAKHRGWIVEGFPKDKE
jgi:adenylate kinase